MHFSNDDICTNFVYVKNYEILLDYPFSDFINSRNEIYRHVLICFCQSMDMMNRNQLCFAFHKTS